MVDRDLVRRRLSLLDTYLQQLAPYRGIDQVAYEHDWKTQRVVERTLHLAIETCMDVADHIVADRRLRVPETGAESFEILAEAQLVPAELGHALALMVGPDGRFLINTELESAAAPITLIQNWNPDAKK